MKSFKVVLLIAMVAITTANAADVDITSNIATSETWTADNVYHLVGQVYVLPGATLTIEPGTLIQSRAGDVIYQYQGPGDDGIQGTSDDKYKWVTDPANPGDQGSLAVCRGAKIIAEGTQNAPIIFTSTRDDLENWHEGANEWGNLTIMGDAYISRSYDTSNTATFGNNVADMEGLVVEAGMDPTWIQYGGENDNDDSGSLKYVSIRYGGKVESLNKELNGLSLGGIGRETDISYVEIMNNVDDGIEIWGGTVCLSHVNIWNIGDDSFDVDQGWRGKAQFGLIVQGYSADADQGSAVGDNCFETDGAEDSDAQPVTTAAIYNFTVVGQPADGDGGTVWRDGARVQYRNCIFMDLGEKLVRPDGDDGDGANGYGFNGTLSLADVWTTSASVYSSVNPAPAPLNNADLYTAQDPTGMLAEIKDSVFFRNTHADAYTSANTYGVLNAANNNVADLYTAAAPDANMPIQALVRDLDADNDGTPGIERGGKTMFPVTFINPCAANSAVTSVATAPANDDFFVPANFRGGFSATNNWLEGWSAVYQYGMTDVSMNTPSGDMNGDGIVDVADFADFATQWMTVN